MDWVQRLLARTYEQLRSLICLPSAGERNSSRSGQSAENAVLHQTYDIVRAVRGRSRTNTLALIGGPQYDGLLDLLPAFEQQTGYRLHVDVCLPHVELNERMAKDLGTEGGRYDLISTHTKYCPSQAEHLHPLDEWIDADELSDFVPRVLELCRIAREADQTDERLMQLPRL